MEPTTFRSLSARVMQPASMCRRQLRRDGRPATRVGKWERGHAHSQQRQHTPNMFGAYESAQSEESAPCPAAAGKSAPRRTRTFDPLIKSGHQLKNGCDKCLRIRRLRAMRVACSCRGLYRGSDHTRTALKPDLTSFEHLQGVLFHWSSNGRRPTSATSVSDRNPLALGQTRSDLDDVANSLDCPQAVAANRLSSRGWHAQRPEVFAQPGWPSRTHAPQ